jgi:TRAP-type uncharacterized transport system fused permease subunit
VDVKTSSQWILVQSCWTKNALIVPNHVTVLTRRLTGWIVPVLIIVAMSYILFLGELMPGAFRAASLPVSDVLSRSLYND